jgi:cellulose synthase operon protein C
MDALNDALGQMSAERTFVFARATSTGRDSVSCLRAPDAVPAHRSPGTMTALRSISMACAIALCLAVPLALQAAPKKEPPTIKDLKQRKIEVRKDEQVQASAPRAMDNYRQFLELQKTDPKLRAEALRRLGDLNLESGQLERLEKELSSVDLQGSSAIKLYQDLLKAYPDYARNDQVLYQLARAYETTGQPEQALTTLDQIVSRYPTSPELDEVQFRRGEILFSNKQYDLAEKAYGRVARYGSRSAFYEQSLYKRGWSLFKQSLNEESLVPFAKVLDEKLLVGDVRDVVRLSDLSRADRELVEDTLRVMSVTFSYADDGAQSIENFTRKNGDTPYSYLLYSRLGDLYVDKQRFQDAATVYRAYVAREPNSDYSPSLAQQAIEAYRKGGFSQLVLDGKREYVERYNFNAPFWAVRQRDEYPGVVQELKTNLKDVATYFHATAQKSKNTEDYQQASRWYRDYLDSFPDDPSSAETNYLLAETLFESKRYGQAATEYERTAYDYPKNPKSATAAYAALVSYQKGEELLDGNAKAQWHEKAVESNIKFAQTFPEHPDSAGVLTRAAQEVFEAKDLERAIELSQSILARQPPVDVPKQRIAWTIIGQSNFDQGNFSQAEGAYIKARDLAGTDPKMKEDLNERVAAAVYKQAEAKKQEGDDTGAVDAFLRVAAVAPDAKIRSTAQYDAATQLINLKLWDRAIGVLESFRRDFPNHELAPDVTKKLAVAYTEANRGAQAAAEFERIAYNPKEERGVQREALLQAAELYEKASNAPKAVTMLEKFVAEYPTPLAEAMEARQRLADQAGKTQNFDRQRYWYREIVKTDQTAGNARTDRTTYLAAKAQLALAEPARDQFRSIRLVAPLKKSLAAKRKALESAMEGYKSAAQYQVAEVTTAATFEMAELYRTLGKDVMNSERPKGLSQDELDQYNSLLEEQAFPFEEQAIKIHEVNVARAKDGVYDDSVKNSYRALAELKPGQFGKTELTTDVVTTLN